jgi:hypothetical protein
VVAEPTPLPAERRQAAAVVLEDGWTACKGCGTRVGFRIVATGHDARVKCANVRCGAWVMLPPPPSVYDDRGPRRI